MKSNYLSLREKEYLAQLKRFKEWLDADKTLWCNLCENDTMSDEQYAWLKKIGVYIEPGDMRFFWEYASFVRNFVTVPTSLALSRDEIVSMHNKIAAQYPLFDLWERFMDLRNEAVAGLFSLEDEPSLNTGFNAWRKRRIAAVKSELGHYGNQISHPVFSFELNDGCSIGCWFCCFAAKRLSAVLDYPSNRDEVRSIIKQCCEIFGKNIASLALPYYSTEPHDNPHYIDFLRDFREETGALLCTSTAAANDIEWIKSLITYYRSEDKRSMWPRLSVLSLDTLKKLHSSFAPIELIDNELLIQVKDNDKPKVSGGRNFKEEIDMRDVSDFSDKKSLPVVPQGTISCVSGFNINLPARTITLFSPCYASKKWPMGFRTFGQTTYTGANDFTASMQELIKRCVFEQPPRDKILRFRDDIKFYPAANEFTLTTPNQFYTFSDCENYSRLADLIAEGNHTYEEIYMELVIKDGLNPILISSAVQRLFEDGFIDETYNEPVLKPARGV